MKRSLLTAGLPTRLPIALLVILFCGIAAHAQGIIIPEPCRRCPRPIPPPPDFRLPRALKVRSIHLTTKVSDQVATTKVEQVFENDTPYLLEGTYFFPLPENVSISEFAMWDGNMRLVGEVRAKAEARRIYDEIVRSRRDPALLEYAGKNLFQASVFPIPPHSDKKIELIYTQVLSNDNGAVAYRYPLGTGWRANSFDGDGVQPVILRDRVGPPTRPQPVNEAPGRISAEIEIDSKVAIRDVYSPSHNIEVRRDGERRVRASFEVRGTAAQPDFQLFYTVSDKDFGLSLLTYREPAKDGYFMLRVAPKTELDERDVLAKDIIFVLDTSGSMADDGKMEKAKAALRQGIGALAPRDHFNIVSFAGEEHLMSGRMIEADEAGKRRAREFVERMRPLGGTNINDAMIAALGQIESGDRPRMLVLITDGQPTVGTTNAGAIQRNIKQANKAHARLFTFGVGYDVNTVLLDGIAAENSGAADYIAPNEDIEVKVSNFFAKVNYPVLSDVRIDWGGVETENIYPRNIPDIFHGSQLVLIGRYRPNASKASNESSSSLVGPSGLKAAVLVVAAIATGNFNFLSYASALSGQHSDTADGKASSARKHRITLIGRVNGIERRFIYDDVRFPEQEGDNEFLPQLWAMRRVGHLMEQIRLNGESRELREEIVELGTRYNIVTPYTSYLVLEPGMQAMEQAQGERLRDRRQAPPSKGVPPKISATPPALPPGDVAEAKSKAPAPMNAPVNGREAVELSRQKEELRKADKVATGRGAGSSDNSAGPRTVAGRTFYLRDGVWTDSEFRADARIAEVKVKFASEVYFSLLKQEPKLADFFALGQRVVVVWKGKVYRVEE